MTSSTSDTKHLARLTSTDSSSGIAQAGSLVPAQNGGELQKRKVNLFVFDPKMMRLIRKQWELFTECSGIEPERRGWLGSYANPAFVEKFKSCVFEVLKVVETQDFFALREDQRVLFCSRVLEFTDGVKDLNYVTDTQDFKDTKLEALQKKMKEHGASESHYKIMNFFNDLMVFAFKDKGLYSLYPNFNIAFKMIEDKKENQEAAISNDAASTNGGAGKAQTLTLPGQSSLAVANHAAHSSDSDSDSESVDSNSSEFDIKVDKFFVAKKDAAKGKTSPNGILTLDEKMNWLLVEPGHTNKDDNKKVFDSLDELVVHYDEHKNKFSARELLLQQVLIGQIMTNYLQNIDDVPQLGNQIFARLADLHKQISSELKSRRGLNEPIAIDDKDFSSVQDAYSALLNILEKPAFKGMYESEEKIKTLKSFDPILEGFTTFMDSPEDVVSDHKWTQIYKELEGISLFKTPKNELVVIFSGNKNWSDRIAYDWGSAFGGHATPFGKLDGLVHKAVLENAKKARRHLNDLLLAKADDVNDCSKVYFVGHSIDGSIAQLVGFHYKTYNPDKKVALIGCGTPQSLDERAARDMKTKMGKMTDIESVNYLMGNDPHVKNLGVTGPAGMRYDGAAFLDVPVPQGILFFAESMKQDTQKAYMQMLSFAQTMHKTMREVYVRTDESYQYLKSLQPQARIAGGEGQSTACALLESALQL